MNQTKPVEGLTKFTKYRNANYKWIPGKKKQFKSLSFIIGTMVFGEPDEIKTQLRVLKHDLKQFVYEHSKDGYYKKDFLLIHDIPNSIYTLGKGYCGFEFHLFLEEVYDKQFLGQYIAQLSKVMDDTIFETHPTLKFKKVGTRKVVIDD